MKFYISQDDRRIIKKNYGDIITDKVFIVDAPIIVEHLLQTPTHFDIFDMFLFNQDIYKKLQMVYHSKRFNDILYLVNDIDRQFLFSIKKFLKDNQIYITDFILLDYSQKINTKIYKFFTNVL